MNDTDSPIGYTQEEMNAMFDAHVASLGKTAREYLEERQRELDRLTHEARLWIEETGRKTWPSSRRWALYWDHAAKFCKECRTVKDLSSFGRFKRAQDGHYRKCLDCYYS